MAHATGIATRAITDSPRLREETVPKSHFEMSGWFIGATLLLVAYALLHPSSALKGNYQRAHPPATLALRLRRPGWQ